MFLNFLCCYINQFNTHVSFCQYLKQKAKIRKKQFMLQTEKMEYENYFVLVLSNMKLPKCHLMVYASE